jgi:Flp pilus assembly pilin Flp
MLAPVRKKRLWFHATPLEMVNRRSQPARVLHNLGLYLEAETTGMGIMRQFFTNKSGSALIERCVVLGLLSYAVCSMLQTTGVDPTKLLLAAIASSGQS